MKEPISSRHRITPLAIVTLILLLGCAAAIAFGSQTLQILAALLAIAILATAVGGGRGFPRLASA